MPGKSQIVLKAPNAIATVLAPSARSSPNAVRDLVSVFLRKYSTHPNNFSIDVSGSSALCSYIRYPVPINHSDTRQTSSR